MVFTIISVGTHLFAQQLGQSDVGFVRQTTDAGHRQRPPRHHAINLLRFFTERLEVPLDCRHVAASTILLVETGAEIDADSMTTFYTYPEGTEATYP
ncbi:MAG: hypothetical protein A2341_04770 [Deltaproteobacteria bacterium RIFOXYB12_FULL_58_9]|nr:MAG: hypothetical protein A2341_04770 [Deltaproteobacteria bacterium RIFOXYB12_FULL_58_9]